MILVKPSFEILQITLDPLKLIEIAGRTCYKSEDRITTDSNIRFCKNIISRKHESVIEHAFATVKFVVCRGFTHELVRHRLASYSQESTRYCNYKGGVTFIIPPWTHIPEGEYEPYSPCCGRFFDILKDIQASEVTWFNSMHVSEYNYQKLLKEGCTPQEARGVLPIDLKTEIVITTNFREWKHIFNLRCDKAAHPQMREIMIPLKNKFQELIPIIYD